MGDIKSAYEIAMEKVAELGEVTEEERLRWKYVPEGEGLAARYLNKSFSLAAALGKYKGPARGFVKEGAMGILIRNISLPRNDSLEKTTRQAMAGLEDLKDDKVAVENIYTQMRHIFDHYRGQGAQQRQQAYENLKAELEDRVRQALQQQTGMPVGMKMDVEKQPQFQEEWRRRQAQIDSQYVQLLDEYKRELAAIT
ncbi:hypothetical protein ACFLS8_05520 [Chloroflexota bacterium]